MKLYPFKKYAIEWPYMFFSFYGFRYRAWTGSMVREGEDDSVYVYRVSPRPFDGPTYIVLWASDYHRIVRMLEVQVCIGLDADIARTLICSYEEANWNDNPEETALKMYKDA